MMRVIDCDAHVEESVETWQYLDPEFYLLRPIPVVFPEDTCFGSHNAAWVIDYKLRFFAANPTLMKRAHEKDVPIPVQEMRDVKQRLSYMDELGIDTQVVFPSIWLGCLAENVELEAALARSYNQIPRGDAYRTRAVAANPPLLNPALRDRKPLAFLADHVRCRNAHVLEMDLSRRVPHHCRPEPLERHSWRFHIDDETADTAARALLRICHRDDLRVVGVFGAGNKSFGPADSIVIALSHGAGLHARWITAGVRLSLSETNPFLTANHGK